MPPVFPLLPPRLSGLVDLASNLSWSWSREARQLFRMLDERLWARGRHDPLRILAEITAERWAQCVADPALLATYDAVMAWHDTERSSDNTWFTQAFAEQRARTIAYFCAEFGIHHSMPIYSGGLGVLAGDHCKEASDLGVPLLGVGILYRGGYFDQRIRLDGWQEDIAVQFDPARTALEPLHGPRGEPYLATVRTFGRDVHIRVWRLRVGRVPVYLLDSDLDENHEDDRALLSKLYAGGPDLRLRQEWLLGVGGARALRAVGIDPVVWHANEGHAAFMLVERLREFVAAGVPVAEAMRHVRATSVFTTHTPVPAGHDIFSVDQVAECAGPVWEELGMTREAFFALGRHPANSSGEFHMTALAIRLSRSVNAVSRTHQLVTRRLWACLWPQEPLASVPIGHVTNGVHLATWMSHDIMGILDRRLGAGWAAREADPQLWERVADIADAELWDAHVVQKHALFFRIREEARHAFTRRAREAALLVGSGVLLDPDALTIGFARRFATYKRANLLFHDVERLLSLVTNATRPVQVIFAGKAHPADTPGKQVLQEVYQSTRDPRFEGRIAFLEDYDLHLAHVLVQGVDLWLNVPREPMEASGTSGMKAALNGVPQLSTLDGWWAEAFDGTNGWAIGRAPPADGDPEALMHDAADADAQAAEQLYHVLERDVVPAYYERDAHNRPVRWLAVMRAAIRVAGAHFTSRRMLQEYVTRYYVPAMLGAAVPDDPPAR